MSKSYLLKIALSIAFIVLVQLMFSVSQTQQLELADTMDDSSKDMRVRILFSRTLSFTRQFKFAILLKN